MYCAKLGVPSELDGCGVDDRRTRVACIDDVARRPLGRNELIIEPHFDVVEFTLPVKP